MKSRTSFFDKTVLKKDLTRFSPLWVLYLIGGLLIMHILSGFYGTYFSDRAYSAANDLNDLIAPMSLLNAIYAFLAAQLLFGDLHNTRLCYGIHALPLRREGWYLTHMTSGLLIGLVPPFVIAVTLMPVLGQFWYVAFLCWGALALQYLFFFALSTCCMMTTGNRFAATAVYAIVNFLALIVQWFTDTVFLPLLPGVRINTTIFSRFCPIKELLSRYEFFEMGHLEDCAACLFQKPGYLYDGLVHDYGFQGLGGDWGYLLILAGVGVALLGVGLLLYRRRHLERAGDFMVFKPMKPIFLTVYTLCVGCVLFYLAYETADLTTGFVFFVVGIFIGFFTGKMLLERTIRVFKGKSFLWLGILYAAVALSLLLTWLDPCGIAQRIPKAEKVEVVYLYDGHLSDYRLNDPDHLPTRTDVIAVTDPEDILAVRQAHSLMLQEHQTDNYSGSHWVTLQYKLKNGSTVSRTYRIFNNGAAQKSLNPYLSKPSYLFGVDTLEQLQQKASNLYCSELGNIPKSMQSEFLKALWLDAQAGYLSTNNNSQGQYMMYVEMQVNGQYRAVFFSEGAPHTYPLLKEAQTYPQLLLQHDTLEELIENTYNICVVSTNTQLTKDDHEEFLTLLWADCLSGAVTRYGKFSYDNYIEVQITNDYLSLSLSSNSKCAQWLDSHYPNPK